MSYYSGHAAIDTTDIDEVYSPLDIEIVEIWFMEKVDNYSDDIELRAIVMDNRHSGFTTIMQGFYEYMKLLDKRQQMEKEQDEYKKYLELKAKFERE